MPILGQYDATKLKKSMHLNNHLAFFQKLVKKLNISKVADYELADS